MSKNNLGMDDSEWLKVQDDLRNVVDMFRDTYSDDANNNKILAETDEWILFADASGQELSDIAEANGVDRRALSKRMHKEARMKYDGDGSGDPFSYYDPIIVYKTVS